MPETDDPQHRAYYQPDPDRVEVRETDDDGTFIVRMPIASTGEVRNQGDDPLTPDEIQGMADQVGERQPPVFLDHGQNMNVSGSRYSAVGKVGEWENPDLVTDDAGETLLEADARMMDPETLPAATGSVREALAAVKSQADRGFSLSSSIGWRDDEAHPGGVDLMEASVVGIPADPRTTSQDAAVELARTAIAERGDDVDPERLVEDFRAVVLGPDDDEPARRHLSAQQADVAETILDAYREEQGNGSVENFESWLWSVAYHQFDQNDFHAANTALEEFYRETTPLDDPITEQFAPFLEEQRGSGDGGDGDNTDDDQGGDARDSVTDEEPDDDRDGQDSMDEQEFRSAMIEMQQQQNETLSALADSLRADDDGDGDDDDEEDDEGDEDDEEDDDRSLTVDGEDVTADDIREMRQELGDAEAETREDGDDDGEEQRDTTTSDPKDLL